MAASIFLSPFFPDSFCQITICDNLWQALCVSLLWNVISQSVLAGEFWFFENLYSNIATDRVSNFRYRKVFRPEVISENKFKTSKLFWIYRQISPASVPFAYDGCLYWWNWCKINPSWCPITLKNKKFFSKRVLAENFTGKNRKSYVFRQNHNLQGVQIPWLFSITRWLTVTGQVDLMVRQSILWLFFSGDSAEKIAKKMKIHVFWTFYIHEEMEMGELVSSCLGCTLWYH